MCVIKSAFFGKKEFWHFTSYKDKFMFYMAQVAVCSKINTKHLYTVRAKHTILEC